MGVTLPPKSAQEQNDVSLPGQVNSMPGFGPLGTPGPGALGTHVLQRFSRKMPFRCLLRACSLGLDPIGTSC